MTHHEQDDMTVRVIPAARWPAIGWLVLVLVVAATAGLGMAHARARAARRRPR